MSSADSSPERLGGPEAVAKHHDRGRLTVRERVDQLLDADSFREQGPIAGYSETDEQGRLHSFTPANYVVGFGKIEGRLCVVGGEDFTPQGRLALVRRISQERVGRRVGVSATGCLSFASSKAAVGVSPVGRTAAKQPAVRSR